MTAITSASPAIIRRTCAGVAPIVRSNASSRRRWVTMNANVLATTKIATMAAKAPVMASSEIKSAR